MTESKIMEKSCLSIGTFSPPLSGSSRSSPPVDVKFKQRHENRNSVSFAGHKVSSSKFYQKKKVITETFLSRLPQMKSTPSTQNY